MKCPLKLQSFQLTRADWRSVHPVVVWVIKTVLETREERQQQTRRLALHRSPALPGDVARAAARPAAAAFAEEVATALGPQRRFRPTQTRGHLRETERVLDVLREYGTLGGEAAAGGAGGDVQVSREWWVSFSFKGAVAQGYASWAQREQVAGSVVGGLLGGEELRRFRSLYEEGREARPLSEAQLALRLHQSKCAALATQLAEARAQLAKLAADHAAGSARLAAMGAAVEGRRAENERVAAEIARFQKLMAESEFAGTVKELQGLVALNETLKTHMEQFEASCKRQAEELRQRVQALRGADEEDGETQYVARVEAAHAEGRAKLQQLRAIAARKNRTVLLLERKIDEVPTHSELAQYGRMLVELYEQINSKFVETRKYYNSFNALDDTRRFLDREVPLSLFSSRASLAHASCLFLRCRLSRASTSSTGRR